MQHSSFTEQHTENSGSKTMCGWAVNGDGLGVTQGEPRENALIIGNPAPLKPRLKTRREH